MYYIWSMLVTLIIFAALQYKEFQKDEKKYNIWTFANLSTLVIIYLISTIILYMLVGIDYRCVNKINVKGGGKDSIGVNYSDIHNIDPSILRRIPDQMCTGFDPHSQYGDDI